MLTRFLGGLVAVLSTVGALHAQSSTPLFAPKPAFVPRKSAKLASEIQTAKADAPPSVKLVPPTAMPVPPMSSNLLPGSDCAADVANACNETCEAACDCLCGPPGRVWVGAEWIYWTAKGNHYPVLATGAPAGTARNSAGTIGGPGTSSLIGGTNNANDDWRSGVRLYGGLWLDECQRTGIEGNFFYLGQSNSSEPVGSDGSQIITRPFTNNVRRNSDGTFSQVAPYPDTQLVSFPNILSGTMRVDSKSDLYGAGANFVQNLCCNPCGRLDLLVGYRYLNLSEQLTINEDLTGLPGSPFPGFRFQVTDSFRTENKFHGGVVGLAWERRFDSFFIGVRSTVAFGRTTSSIDIDGQTVITDPQGNRSQFVGGLLAQPSNIGHYEESNFSVIPEIGVKLGVQVTDHLRLYAGYNFLYWSNVIRPGDVIDTRVNSSQIPPRTNQTGDLYPRFSPKTSDYYVHGVMVGLEFRY